MRLTIRGALALLGNTLAWAQPVSLTVEAAVEQALRQQPVREVFAQRVQAGQQLGLQAGLKPNPRLYLQSENTRFWSQPSFSYPGASDNFLYLTQPVESGGKRERRMELAAENVERSRLDAELFDRQLALRVRVAYWTAAGAARSAELVRAQADSFRALVENNRLRARVGIIAEADVLRSEVELQRLVAMQRQAEADAQRLGIALSREMGATVFPDLLLTSALQDSAGSSQSLETNNERTEMKLALQVSKVAEANLRLQRANAVPTPDIVYGYKRTAGFDTLMGGLQIDLPLRNRNQGFIGAASADVRAAQAQSRVVTAQIAAERQAARSDYLARRQLAQQLVPSIRDGALQTLRLAREAYAIGGVDLLRLIDAERVYLEAEGQYSRTLVELRQAEAALAYALGGDR